MESTQQIIFFFSPIGMLLNCSDTPLSFKIFAQFLPRVTFFLNYLFMKTRCSYIKTTDSNQAFNTKWCLLRTDLPTPRFSTTAILLTCSLRVFDT